MLVRRDPEGYVFSEVRNMKSPDPRRYIGNAVVIDRQKGRQFDSETVINRAKSLAELLGIPYDEDLTQQCRRDMGYLGTCGCPRCVQKNKCTCKEDSLKVTKISKKIRAWNDNFRIAGW